MDHEKPSAVESAWFKVDVGRVIRENGPVVHVAASKERFKMTTVSYTLSKTLLLLTILLWPLAGGREWTLHAQQSQTASLLPTFEVASVKPNKSVPDNATGIQLGCHGTDRDSGINPNVAIPIGQCTVKYMPFKLILEFAYDVPMFQSMYMVSGGPSWLDSDRFDIQAKAEKTATDAQLRSRV
jgi:hypothetical protein